MFRHAVGILRLALVLGLAFAGPTAMAQTYPTKPVRLIIPFAPGGSNDVFGRVIASQLTERLGQSVFVDNRELVTLMTLGAAPELLVPSLLIANLPLTVALAAALNVWNV